MSLQPIRISAGSPADSFPDVDFALAHPNGLLAVGGDLGPERLMCAYRRGIFPWYGDDQPILWWSPDPRAVILPDGHRISRSLRKRLRSGRFRISLDVAFEEVIGRCADPRRDRDGTWITNEMQRAYCRLHGLGHAHSVECWNGPRLVGGLYGVSIGRAFFGESMFSLEPDASKVALAHLMRLGFELVDCQLPSEHLARQGARLMERERFVRLLDDLCAQPMALARGDITRANW